MENTAGGSLQRCNNERFFSRAGGIIFIHAMWMPTVGIVSSKTGAMRINIGLEGQNTERGVSKTELNGTI